MTTSNNETSATIDLFGDLDISTKVKRRIQNDVGDFLLEQTLTHVGQKESPIEGAGAFEPLKKGPYKKRKLAEIGNGEANLEFSGTMLDETDYKNTSEGIKIGVFGKAAPRADGHNDLSGNSPLKRRQFIPNVGDKYKSDIEDTVNQIIEEAIVEETELSKEDFEDVETTSELFAVLEDRFGLELSRSALRVAVLRNEDLVEILTDLDLLDLL